MDKIVKFVNNFFIILFGIYLFSTQVNAHPHMFVDVQPYLISAQDNKIVVHIKWFFDEFTSEGFFMDYDENKNQKLDPSEKQAIKKDFSEGLKKYDYFLKLQLNGTKIIPRISKFIINTKIKVREETSISDIISGAKKSSNVNIIYYEFDTEIAGKIKKENKLTLAFYDSTLYSALYPMQKVISEKGIKIKSNELVKSKCLFKVTF